MENFSVKKKEWAKQTDWSNSEVAQIQMVCTTLCRSIRPPLAEIFAFPDVHQFNFIHFNLFWQV